MVCKATSNHVRLWIKSAYIGTWGAMFYAIDRRSGEKIWEFDTKRGRYFSPGACWPGSTAVYTARRDE